MSRVHNCGYDNGADERGDRELDDFYARVDLGEQCPQCKGHKEITREVALGIPLFRCACGCEWFDCITQPTTEAA
jgi:hypothetical protein